ncbi:hypothetical protein CC77DRAFT_1045374 [Alternaria alternata]|uniref:WSC domain-containing protein n=1 Tax=Alternaria alternata TaxID=5599 RepID=A0A177D2W8_ALTAL|nr:hypothetical protein CC77DRAFT_1045374 [Alternaria alternata]OAG13389.1 hypothetical protein CC77DRAFT_1045374 [Alternaria alternata]
MKLTAFIVLAELVRLVVSERRPNLQWDPETAKDCVEWFDGGWDLSCEETRKMFGISPELFHKWNPSVGLDCKPWNFQSYCVLTQERVDTEPPKWTSTISTTTTTATSSTVTPSPTSWTDIGCYVEDPTFPLLDQNMSPNGDASLTIPDCKDTCYRDTYRFAGVQEGNQCWCGTYVIGQWAKNQTDCNVPCTGDKTTYCGGKGLLKIFQEAGWKEEATRTVVSGSSITSTNTASTSTSQLA